MRIVELTQRTPEWLAWRRGGIGGSDAPIILGNTPFKRTVRELYFEKKGIRIAEEKDNSFVFDIGERLEKIARRDILELFGEEMIPACIEMKEDPRFISSLDGLLSNAIVEVKYIGKEPFARAVTHCEIPAHHYTQIQHQLMVSGKDLCYWFAGNPSGECTIQKVERNNDYIEGMKMRELEFMHQVENSIEPPLSDKDYFVPQDLTLLNQLRQAKFDLERNEAAFETLKERIINTYGHDRIAGDGIRVYKTAKTGAWTVKVDR